MRFPAQATRDELRAFLKDELGFCGCAGARPAFELLRDSLRIINGWNHAFGKDPAVRHAECTVAFAELIALIQFDQVQGLATWFLYHLNHHGVIEHAGNVTECWLSPDGVRLLAAIESYPEFETVFPPP